MEIISVTYIGRLLCAGFFGEDTGGYHIAAEMPCGPVGFGERAYVAVLDMPRILPFATFDRKYEGIAKYPAVTRDISMVIPKSVLAGQIEEVIENKGGSYLESYKLFDIYEGAQIKEGFKSVAYSIVFRAKDKTLEEADVASAMKRILKGLEGLDAELRQ